MAVGATLLILAVGTQCDVLQPLPAPQQVSLSLTPTAAVVRAQIGSRIVPFSGTLLSAGAPLSGVPFHLHLQVGTPDSGVVQVVHSDSLAADSVIVLKRGFATLLATPMSSVFASDPTPVSKTLQAVVPILAPDTNRATASPRAKTLNSLGDTLTLLACGFTQTTRIGCNPGLPVTWRLASGTAVALRNTATGFIQALTNGSATLVGEIDSLSASWAVTVQQVARRVRLVSGSAQVDSVAGTLAQAFVVQIADANDSTMRAAGVQVGWKVTAGGGTFVGGSDTANSTTDANGLASITLKLGSAGAQGARASVASLLGTAAAFTATAYAPQPPATPTSAAQYKSNCTTALATGSATDELAACFKATGTDPDPGALIRLAVEVKPIGTAFTGTATAIGTAVASGAAASVSVSTGLLDDTGYHWQFWAIDQTNRVSAVTSFGGNAETAADFATAVPQAPTAPTSAAQFAKDCTTPLSTGGTVDTLAVCMQATVSDPDPGATIRLAVEVKPVGTTFTGTATATSAAVASGASASVAVSGLADTTGYHWQYWAIDETSRTSATSSFGGNAETAADFTVSRPAIALSATSVTFSTTVGGANPVSQTVNVTNGGAGTLGGMALGTVTYASGSGWLTTTTLSAATAPATLTLQPTLGSLAAGVYTATVPITAAIARNTPQTVNVTFAVTCVSDPGEPNDNIASATQLTAGTAVTAKVCSGTDADYFKIDLVEGQRLALALTTLPADYRLDLYSPQQALLLSSNNSGTTSEAITYTATATGTYYAKVSGSTSSAFSANSTYTLTPTLTRPTMALGYSSYAFTMPFNYVDAIGDYVRMSNSSGVGYLRWQSASNRTWLWTLDNNLSVVTNGTGVCCGSGTDSLVWFGLSASGLTEGAYSGTLALTAPAASNSPQNLPVTLTVTHDLVMNGSFELWDSGWLAWRSSGDVVRFINASSNAHTGSRYLALGVDGSTGLGKNSASAALWQKVRMPSLSSATLSWYTYITTNETSSVTAYDTLWVSLWDSTATGWTRLWRMSNTLSNLNASTGWAGWTLNLPASIASGRTVWLEFDMASDASNPTVFRIDDVSINWVSAAAAPPFAVGRDRPSTSLGESSAARPLQAPPTQVAPGLVPELPGSAFDGPGRPPTTEAAPRMLVRPLPSAGRRP